MTNGSDHRESSLGAPGAPLPEDLTQSVTRLLVDAEAGSQEVWNQIYTLVYQDLHRLARSQIRLHAQPGLSPSSLISEAWIKLARAHASASCRPHLMSLIARAMRFVLLDEARRSFTGKRGGNIHFDGISAVDGMQSDSEIEELLALDRALESLAGIDTRLAKVVELRYFGGLDEAEIAALLGVTERTIRRDWRKARAYLQSQLDASGPG